jgi:hypothetical protein
VVILFFTACSLQPRIAALFQAEQNMSIYSGKVIAVLLILAAIQFTTGIRAAEVFGFDEGIYSCQDIWTPAALVGHCFVLELQPRITPVYRLKTCVPGQKATILCRAYRGPPPLA